MDKKWIPLAVPNLKGRETEYAIQAIETEWISSAGADVEYVSDCLKKAGTE